MSLLVERIYPANFMLNRLVIIYFESWHFTVSLYKKNSFGSAQLRFSCVSRAKMGGTKGTFSTYFIFSLPKKWECCSDKKIREVYGESVHERLLRDRILLFTINVWNDLVFTHTNTWRLEKRLVGEHWFTIMRWGYGPVVNERITNVIQLQRY